MTDTLSSVSVSLNAPADLSSSGGEGASDTSPAPVESAASAPAGAPASAPAAASPSASAESGPYILPASVPTQSGPMQIAFDFNDGARVRVPELRTADGSDPGQWRVRLLDYENGNVLFDSPLKGGTVASSKKFRVAFRIEIYHVPAVGEQKLILEHDITLAGRKVLVQLPVGTLGDTLAWLPAALRLARETGADVTVTVSDLILPLVSEANPGVTLVGHKVASAQADFTAQFYATYNIGLFFQDKAMMHQPTDFRHVGLHRTAAYILGVEPWDDSPPPITIPDGDTPPIEGRYVVIATQASTQCKYWNNPAGWHEVITFLKAAGYRVICIDQRPFHGTGYIFNHIPHGCEDETGNRPLSERARWLKHASFFIGLSSGLAWLAHAAHTPVVMISGFTHPNNEFETPYRVINWHTCNSCWNDVQHQFDHKDFLWCPRHAGTERQFECTRLITGTSVIRTIRKLMTDKGLPGADAQVAAAS